MAEWDHFRRPYIIDRCIVTLGVGGTVGVVLGLAAGWYGGIVDDVITRLVDIKLSIPLILVALVLVITLASLRQLLWRY